MKQVLRSLKHSAFPFIPSQPPRIQWSFRSGFAFSSFRTFRMIRGYVESFTSSLAIFPIPHSAILLSNVFQKTYNLSKRHSPTGFEFNSTGVPWVQTHGRTSHDRSTPQGSNRAHGGIPPRYIGGYRVRTDS